MTSTLTSDDANIHAPVTFEVTPERATDLQLAYLNDLYMHIKLRPVTDRTREQWAQLTTGAASALIKTYWSQLPGGREGNWEGVTEDDSLFSELSAAGREWVRGGCVPSAMAGVYS